MKKFLMLVAFVAMASSAWAVEKQMRTICLGGVQYYVFSEWRQPHIDLGFGYGYMAPAYDPVTKEVKLCPHRPLICNYDEKGTNRIAPKATKRCNNVEEE